MRENKSQPKASAGVKILCEDAELLRFQNEVAVRFFRLEEDAKEAARSKMAGKLENCSEKAVSLLCTANILVRKRTLPSMQKLMKTAPRMVQHGEQN